MSTPEELQMPCPNCGEVVTYPPEMADQLGCCPHCMTDIVLTPEAIEESRPDVETLPEHVETSPPVVTQQSSPPPEEVEIYPGPKNDVVEEIYPGKTKPSANQSPAASNATASATNSQISLSPKLIILGGVAVLLLGLVLGKLFSGGEQPANALELVQDPAQRASVIQTQQLSEPNLLARMTNGARIQMRTNSAPVQAARTTLQKLKMSDLLPTQQNIARYTSIQNREDIALLFFSDKDFTNSLAWMKLAAAIGGVQAAWDVGYHYEKGYGTATNFSKALQYYKIAASANGNADLKFKVGQIYLEGKLTKKDTVLAWEWFKEANLAGHPHAMKALNNIAPYLPSNHVGNPNYREIQVIAASAKPVSGNSTYITFGWKVRLRNNTKYRATARVEFRYLDSQGYAVDEKTIYDLKMGAGEVKEFTGTHFVDTEEAQEVKKVNATARLR